MDKLWKELLFYVSIILFCISFTLPIVAYTSGRVDSAWPAWNLFLDPLAGYSQLSTYIWATILLFLAFVFSKFMPKFALVISTAALVLGLLTFTYKSVPVDGSGLNFIYIDHLAIGYYVWETSIVLLILYCITQSLFVRRTVM